MGQVWLPFSGFDYDPGQAALSCIVPNQTQSTAIFVQFVSRILYVICTDFGNDIAYGCTRCGELTAYDCRGDGARFVGAPRGAGTTNLRHRATSVV